MTRNPGLRYLSLLFIIVLLPLQTLADVDLDAGKGLFKNNCASCHNKNMKDDLTGPALAGYQERWADYSREELYQWIRNSQGMIASGHPKATEMWNEWKPTVMTSFPNITDAEIENVLGYIEAKASGALDPLPIAAVGGGTVESGYNNSGWIYWLVFAILGFLAFVLTRVVSNLDSLETAKTTGGQVVRSSIWDTILSKGVISFLIFAFVVIGGYYTVNNAIGFGRQQNYTPEQPIKFSHEIHAGLHKIECQYCHDGARRSKHSVIPSANTCMNCHKAIKSGSVDGTAELTKVFASIGYDPIKDKYLEDYENVSQDSIARLYKNWIGQQYVKDNDLNSLDSEGEAEVEDQWENIVKSLTSDIKPNVQGPIEWIRVHNLPDHVYFNHAQHVSVGEVECQTCHGKVEEMAVVGQFAPLSMGWCINCHRETEVKFADNEYYKSYEKYHTQLANGEKTKVTVEDIGGLECQKCHY